MKKLLLGVAMIAGCETGPDLGWPTDDSDDHGEDGQSVVGDAEPPGIHCPYGGVAYSSASGVDYVCDGAPGAAGSAGPQGAAGATGADGSDGAVGPAGLAGAPGLDGAVGATGADGSDGIDGESVWVTSIGPDANCPEGGVEVSAANGVVYVCDGAPGAVGPAGADGSDGAVGPAGVAGAPGLDGAVGAPGADGSDGVDGESVWVTSIGPDANCPEGGVELNAASGVAYVCDGAPGAAGADGAAGPTGVAGAPGLDGAVGPAGVAGAPGLDGAVGPAGVAGAPGLDGAAGPSGVAGAPGLDGAVGAPGADGSDGVDGESVWVTSIGPDANCPEGGVELNAASGVTYVCDGAPGAVGPAGANGSDGAVGPAGVAGAPGLDGAVGPAGVAGAPGLDGAVGPAGVAGAPGLDGAVGPAGVAGTPGVDGAAGPAGVAGAPGLDGAAGSAGADGSDGADGESVWVTSIGPDANCPEGGVELNAASGVTYVCDGAPGAVGPAGANGSDGAVGPAGAEGVAGAPGATGAAGVDGAAGVSGLDGESVVALSVGPDATCPYGGVVLVSASGVDEVCNGEPGAVGATGAVGPQGPPGEVGSLAYGYFYAQMPPDNAATVAAGAPVLFPRDGPLTGIVRLSASEFMLPTTGIYDVSWQVSVNEPGQMVVGLELDQGVVELDETMVGRATGTSQLMNRVLVETTLDDAILTIRNPTGNTPALTITPLAGGAQSVTASLIILQIR